MIGTIVEIKGLEAKVQYADIVTGFLPFCFTPFSETTPILHYKIGDKVVFEIEKTSNIGAILGVIK